MTLLLVQHGQAKTEAEDPARPLNDAGVKAVEKMAKWLAVSEIQVNEIRHSGKKRAEQTASIFAEHLAPHHGVAAIPGLNPKDEVRPIADKVSTYSGSLMLVGHLPFLNRLAGYLITGYPEHEVVRFQNGGVVCLRKTEGQWSIEWVVVPDLVKL